MEYVINLIWDEEVGVWVATSEDVPGLVLESGSFDALIERVRFSIPELIKLNTPQIQPLSVTFVSKRQERIAL